VPKELKLKGTARRRRGPHPLGELPPSLAVEIGKRIVHRIAVGSADISGDDFGKIFADSISGQSYQRPLGIADVSWESCAWSVKTVQSNHPFAEKQVRIISGRNSPAYSSGISDPFADVQVTGSAVLDVWNARVNEALASHNDLRIFIMIRNMATLEFTLSETEAIRYVASEYYWQKNKRNNLDGYDCETRSHHFTWQPHGSQFTVIHHVPTSAYRFRIVRRPGVVPEDYVLKMVCFDESWIEPVTMPSENT